jgi:hypothetical protein
MLRFKNIGNTQAVRRLYRQEILIVEFESDELSKLCYALIPQLAVRSDKFPDS